MIRLFLEIDTTDESVAFFEKQELASAEVLQHAFAVDAAASNERTLDLERRIDKFRQRVSIGDLCKANGRVLLRRKSNGPGILRRGRVLLRCAKAGCIWRCGRCGRRSRF